VLFGNALGLLVVAGAVRVGPSALMWMIGECPACGNGNDLVQQLHMRAFEVLARAMQDADHADHRIVPCQ
jgi:hypothetical protein